MMICTDDSQLWTDSCPQVRQGEGQSQEGPRGCRRGPRHGWISHGTLHLLLQHHYSAITDPISRSASLPVLTVERPRRPRSPMTTLTTRRSRRRSRMARRASRRRPPGRTTAMTSERGLEAFTASTRHALLLTHQLEFYLGDDVKGTSLSAA